MRKILFVFAAILALGYYSSAQMFDPVHWDQEVKSLGNNEYELIFKAKLDQGWAIYSQTSDPNAAQPTEVTFKKAIIIVLLEK